MVVREFRRDDQTAWRRLWADYLRFYDADVADDVTEATIARLLDPGSSVIGRVAEQERQVVGFTTTIIHAGTWSKAPVAYLEDLFVDPAARRGGTGRALMNDIVALGRSLGWSRIYWHTRSDNRTARALYDTFTTADDFVRYRLPLS